VLPALVLTAGLGTRLDPITRLVAKPAVPLGDRTLVERILENLRRQGVTDAVLNLHHRPETITAIVGDGVHLGLRVRYSWEREILGSAGGPRRALPLLDSDTFLIVNGDTLCEVPLAPMLDAHEHSSADVTLAVVPNPAPDHYNGIVAGDDRVVSGFVSKGPAAAGSWHFVGIQIAAADAFASLADGVPSETIAGIYRGFVAAQPGRVCIWPVTAPFIDVGTSRDYFEAARAFPRAASAIPGLTDCVVWPGADIAPGARLTRCVVLDRVRVPADLVASNAVIVPASVVRPGDAAERRGDLAVFPLARLA
jgi:NDP-sugar pyrophosphorylase family protein